MSARVSVNRPVAAFCDVELGTWGVCVGGPAPRLAMGGPGGPEDVPWQPVELALDAESSDWDISSDSASLLLRPLAGTAGEHGLIRCDVSGTHTVDGETLPIAATGARCAAPGGDKLGSVRLVATWFAHARGVTLLAARPSGSSGQDRDTVAVVADGEADGMSVFDPRLSTTYDADMRPRRMGIELWLGETEEGEQYPRRVAGQSAGPRAEAMLDGVRANACLMSCQSRGAEGVGVYLLLSTA